MKKLFLLFLNVCLLAGCVKTPAPAETPVQSEVPVESAVTESAVPEETAVVENTVYVDDAGREVTLPESIDALVPSGPLSQMVLLALAPEMLVGLGSKWPSDSKTWLPEAALDLPYFGKLYGGELNVEELAAAGPKLIIDIGEQKKSTVEDLDGLQETTGIASIFFEADLSTMPDVFRRLGTLLGKADRGEELAVFCEKIASQTDEVMKAVGDNKKTALYVLGEEGHNVLAKGSYHAEVLDMLVENIAVLEEASSKGSGNEVDMEQIALWNPDVVIFAPESIYSTVGETDVWKDMQAIASGNYLEIPASPYNWLGNPPSVQRYLGMIYLPSVLYPEVCTYDAKEEIKEFYQLFYGCELSDEMYEELIANAGLAK